MKPGDTVTRNPKYKWCLCAGYKGCWCRKGGVWKILETRTQPCQSGTMVVAEQNGKKTDWVDSSHFVEEVQKGLFIR